MWGLAELARAVDTADDVAEAACLVADQDPAWRGVATRAVRTAGGLRAQLDELITAEALRGVGDIEVSLHETEG